MITNSSLLCQPKSLLVQDLDFWNCRSRSRWLKFKSCAIWLNISSQCFYAVCFDVVMIINTVFWEQFFWLDKLDINHSQVSCIKMKLHQHESQKILWDWSKTKCEHKKELYVIKYLEIRSDILIPTWAWERIHTLLQNAKVFKTDVAMRIP